MKKIELFLYCSFFMNLIHAQSNLTLVSHLPYNEELASVWGYVSPTGVEYALVGVESGLSIVSLADPTQPIQVQHVAGTSSIWREMKVWGNYAYVVTEGGNNGLQIIDLAGLPSQANVSYWKPFIGATNETLETAHTIWIDDKGYLYLSGTNIGNGQVLIADLRANPTNPTFLGLAGNLYAHDCYSKGDTLYSADVYAGTFSVFNISDRTNPILKGSQQTPFAFTHNAWTSDNGKVLFTTDERGDAYIGAYDVTDLTDIQELDRYRRLETENKGVIPHNVHVRNDFVVTAYYTDGVSILDGNRPKNLVEIAHYDTYSGADGGFHGCWGVFPYFSSGLILASDIETGLWVLRPNYQRAAYLEGMVTEKNSGNPIFDAKLDILNTPIYAHSELSGIYRTGRAQNGTIDVLCSKTNYRPLQKTVSIANGVVTTLDFELEPATTFNYTATVQEKNTNTKIQDAVVEFSDGTNTYTVRTDMNGNFTLNGIKEGLYNVRIGHWGHILSESKGFVLLNSVNNSIFELNKGYRDEFALDLGWTTSFTPDVTKGKWEWAVPQFTRLFGGALMNPMTDSPTDIGNKCYVTGNNGISHDDDAVLGTAVTLSSPVFDGTIYQNPELSFRAWFVTVTLDSFMISNDSLKVYIDNGNTTVLVASIYHFTQNIWGDIPLLSFRIKDYITPTTTMKIIFKTGNTYDRDIVEAAIDEVEIKESGLVNVQNTTKNIEYLKAYPNPSTTHFTIEMIEKLRYIKVYDALGRLVEYISEPTENQELGRNWKAGIYWLSAQNQEGKIKVSKLIKH